MYPFQMQKITFSRVTPILKKPNLDHKTLLHYHPISNPKYNTKILERIVVAQLRCYLNDNNLKTKMQSAYRANHSTETALLRVRNDILLAST